MTDKLAPPLRFASYVDESMHIEELLMMARHTDRIDSIAAIIDFLVEELSTYVNDREHDDLADRVPILVADLARQAALH